MRDKQKCYICGKHAIVDLPYGPHVYCKKHFCEFFEKRIKRTTKKQNLHKRDKILIVLDNSTNSDVMLHISNFFHNNKKIVKIKLKEKDPWRYERKMIKKALKYAKEKKCNKIFYASDINFESCRILSRFLGYKVPMLSEKFILPFLTTPRNEIKLYAKIKKIKNNVEWHYPKLERFLKKIVKRNPSVMFNIIKAKGVLKKFNFL